MSTQYLTSLPSAERVIQFAMVVFVWLVLFGVGLVLFGDFCAAGTALQSLNSFYSDQYIESRWQQLQVISVIFDTAYFISISLS